jgi:hypothetical protein
MKKLKLGYYCADVNPNKTKSLGIYKATKEILKELLNKKSVEITLILSKESEKFFREFECKKKITKSEGSYILNKLFRYPSFANKIAKKESFDILFFPKGHLPFFKISKTKYISWIHDLIPIYYLKKGKFKMFFSSFLLWWSAKKSDLIFTDSEYSKEEISKISRKKIIVIPLGYSVVKPKNPKIKGDYVFVIGNKNPHKNLDNSIELLTEYNKKFKKQYTSITSSGNLSEEELAGLYKYAKFSIFLSDIEGFGLPLIESYAYGTSVVFNNKTSLAEIGSGLPGACTVEDKSSVFNAIKEVENLSKKEIGSISRALKERFNWKNCGKVIFKSLFH